MAAGSTNVLTTQFGRDFAVQIRSVASDGIVGTGVVISLEGRVVTCAHVVEDAGVDPKAIAGEEVAIFFPQTELREEKSRRAIVAACFPNHDDDVVVLKLTGAPPPLWPKHVAVLGSTDTVSAAARSGRPFSSYGYRRLDKYAAGWAQGTIVGSIEQPRDSTLQADPVQLRSGEINKGMSGAGVLDTERNLVVGIISETWFPDESTKDSNTSWAVDAQVLALKPLGLEVRADPLPLRAAPQPTKDTSRARSIAVRKLEPELGMAPSSLREWVGREDLLAALDRDYENPNRLVTGLIGSGGAGKGSIARRWIDQVLEDDSRPKPDGVFWWDFYERPQVEEFLEAVLVYLSGGRVDTSAFPSTTSRVRLAAAMLSGGRYILVLDGLEVLQDREGDRHGLIRNWDMNDFVRSVAGGEHGSYCVITSQVPVLDLLEYRTYAHLTVDELSNEEGRRLLQKVGVGGSDDEFDQVVETWDGHALALSLIGRYLVDKHGGKISELANIAPPTDDESRYDRVHRALRRYRDVEDDDRAFLMILSAFRLPVREDAFGPVFRSPTTGTAVTGPLANLDDETFDGLVGKLLERRLLRASTREGATQYAAHPLIRDYFRSQLSDIDEGEVQKLHARIAAYYVEMSSVPHPHSGLVPLQGQSGRTPTLRELGPLIEAVHHDCQAREFDEAYSILEESINQGMRAVLIKELGANDVYLDLLRGFFPGEDTSLQPQVTDVIPQSDIIGDFGFALMNVGRLRESLTFHERGSSTGPIESRSTSLINLGETKLHLGQIQQAEAVLEEGLSLADRIGDLDERSRQKATIQSWLALAKHLRGQPEEALVIFQRALASQKEQEKEVAYLYSWRGVNYGKYLPRAGSVAEGRELAEANLEDCRRAGWLNTVSRCLWVLADLYALDPADRTAGPRYDESVEIARGVAHRLVLLEALTARGRWAARQGQAAAAHVDLNEALEYAYAGEYRILEADIHVGLAWAHHRSGADETARREAERAEAMSDEMDYHWGKVDAQEVLAALDAR